MQHSSIRYRRLSLATGFALLLSVGVTPTAGAAEPTDIGGFYARDCVEVSAIVSVPPANADAELPDGYTSSSFFGLPGGPGVPGSSSLLMGVETCQSGTIDGVPFDGPFAFGERVLSVDRHDAASGYHFYAVEQVTDNRKVYDLMHGAGFDIAYLPGVGATADAAGGISEGGIRPHRRSGTTATVALAARQGQHLERSRERHKGSAAVGTPPDGTGRSRSSIGRCGFGDGLVDRYRGGNRVGRDQQIRFRGASGVDRALVHVEPVHPCRLRYSCSAPGCRGMLPVMTSERASRN